ncbi:uncharacterized protein LOC105240969 isoform X4 [Ailuropoda melanoleuca]|uniref:uncharacterized protein LOC105240969 isoform X4 n=1 Tax=Ailuropoda melanoleuca TaxID=9646 RepID=UPI001495036B|nr:uncharacterized protein LOC105240969 isoform X4 [Ailuropoda melanoleuca]
MCFPHLAIQAPLTSEACPPSPQSTCVHRSWTRASVRMPWQESLWCSLWASQARCRSRSRTVRPLPSSSGCGTSSALPVRGPGTADPVPRAAGQVGRPLLGKEVLAEEDVMELLGPDPLRRSPHTRSLQEDASLLKGLKGWNQGQEEGTSKRRLQKSPA